MNQTYINTANSHPLNVRLHGYEEVMDRIRKEENRIELCGGQSFEESMEKSFQKDECISVEQLFHLIVNDVHKIYQEDDV